VKMRASRVADAFVDSVPSESINRKVLPLILRASTHSPRVVRSEAFHGESVSLMLLRAGAHTRSHKTNEKYLGYTVWLDLLLPVASCYPIKQSRLAGVTGSSDSHHKYTVLIICAF